MAPDLRFLRRDPIVDAPFEDIERHRTRFEHDVVEGPEIELVAERRLRAAAAFHDLELADQIGGGLSRRSEEHTSELQPLMRISYAVFCSTTKSTHHKLPTAHTFYRHHNSHILRSTNTHQHVSHS